MKEYFRDYAGDVTLETLEGYSDTEAARLLGGLYEEGVRTFYILESDPDLMESLAKVKRCAQYERIVKTYPNGYAQYKLEFKLQARSAHLDTRPVSLIV